MFCQFKHGAHAGAAALPAGNEQEAEVPLRAVDGHAAQVRAQVFGRGRGQQPDAHPGAGQQEQLLQRPGVKDRVSFQTQLIVVLAQQLLGVAPGVLLSQDQPAALPMYMLSPTSWLTSCCREPATVESCTSGCRLWY